MLVTVTVVTGDVRATPPKLSDQLPADGEVNCGLVPSVNVLPFAATVNTFVFTESKVPVITGAAFVVTVCEFTVGAPRVGVGEFVVVNVALLLFGVTAKKTDPGSWLTVVP
jgi:hypothetical protein